MLATINFHQWSSNRDIPWRPVEIRENRKITPYKLMSCTVHHVDADVSRPTKVAHDQKNLGHTS